MVCGSPYLTWNLPSILLSFHSDSFCCCCGALLFSQLSLWLVQSPIHSRQVDKRKISAISKPGGLQSVQRSNVMKRWDTLGCFENSSQQFLITAWNLSRKANCNERLFVCIPIEQDFQSLKLWWLLYFVVYPESWKILFDPLLILSVLLCISY